MSTSYILTQLDGEIIDEYGVIESLAEAVDRSLGHEGHTVEFYQDDNGEWGIRRSRHSRYSCSGDGDMIEWDTATTLAELHEKIAKWTTSGKNNELLLIWKKAEYQKIISEIDNDE